MDETKEQKMEALAAAVWEREKKKELDKIVMELLDEIPISSDRASYR